MAEWLYDGYTKVHSDNRRYMIEEWIWKCAKCGHEVRKPYGNQNRPEDECPVCMANQKNRNIDN